MVSQVREKEGYNYREAKRRFSSRRMRWSTLSKMTSRRSKKRHLFISGITKVSGENNDKRENNENRLKYIMLSRKSTLRIENHWVHEIVSATLLSIC